MSKQELRVYNLAREVFFGKLTIIEFSILIGKSYRQGRRIIKKIRKKDAFGVRHGNRGRVPINKTDSFLEECILKLLRTKYYDFNLTHFREMILENEKIIIGKNIIHRIARKHSLVKRPKRRPRKVYRPRPRFPNPGMLIQFDGSEHMWFGNFVSDLIVGIDDADGKIIGGEFFIGETSMNCMKVMKDIISSFGIPKTFYLDQAGYFGKKDRQWNSQIGRALKEIGSSILLAGSPQAKGRVERLFNTLQDRLIAELRLNNVTNINQANDYLINKFIPNFNKQFSISPRSNKGMFREVDPLTNLENVFCLKDQRKITNANMFSWNGGKYYIDERFNYRFRTIDICTRYDGSIGFNICGKSIKVVEYKTKSSVSKQIQIAA